MATIPCPKLPVMLSNPLFASMLAPSSRSITRRRSAPKLTRFVDHEFGTVDIQRSADNIHSAEGEASRAVDNDVGVASGGVVVL